MKYLCIHHTAVVNNGSPQLYAVNRYHREKWNMLSRLGWYVGYTYFIDVDGTVTQTRAWTEETAANKGHNCDVPERCDTISVCLADNYNESVSVAFRQLLPLERLIKDIRKHYPNIKVVGHRDLQEGRTCPGINIDATDFEDWNKLRDGADPEDSQKEIEIQKLQSRLDSLRELLRKLLEQVRHL